MGCLQDAAAVSAATSNMEEEARVAAEKRMTACHTLAAQITTSHQLTSQLSRAEVIEKKANWWVSLHTSNFVYTRAFAVKPCCNDL
jgi:hypothetical protein